MHCIHGFKVKINNNRTKWRTKRKHTRTKRTARFEYHRYNKHVCTIFSIFYSANIMYSQSSIPNKRLNGWLVSRLEYWMRFAVAFFSFLISFSGCHCRNDYSSCHTAEHCHTHHMLVRQWRKALKCRLYNETVISHIVFTLFHLTLSRLPVPFSFIFFRYFDFCSLFSCSAHPWGYIYT